MAKIKRIITSEVEGRNLSDFYGDNSYSFDSTGQINYYGENKMGPVIEPGIVYGSNADSGDGYGYNTIKLVPHSTDGYINDDRYLIIDPTAPNHIHIRAGGTQDASNAELILGGEETNVKVTDSNKSVVINTFDSNSSQPKQWIFDNVGNLTSYHDMTIGVATAPGNLNLSAYSNIVFSYSNGEGQENNGVFILDKTNPNNRVATIGDLGDATNFSENRWSPLFYADGLTFTGTEGYYPTYNSYYVKVGKMVTFNIAIDLSTVTNFGTGQFKTELPFLPIPTAANHFSAWAWIDPSQPADELNGHIQMVADHLPNSQVLDLHWLKETTATPKPLIESLLSQGNPATFTTASKIYINGTYICA